MRIIKYIAFFGLIFSQEVLDRLIVPIYYQINLSTGYDSNIFTFSSEEMKNVEMGSDFLGTIKYFDSDYYKPEFKIIYSPVLLDQFETNFVFRIKSIFVRLLSLKNTLNSSAKFEIKFGSYHWLKAGYSFTPNNYLKRYQDLDVLSNDYFDCTYSNSTGFISYSVPLNNKNWTRVTWELSDYYYNTHFTEFDMQSHEFNWFISHKSNQNLKLGINIGIGNGNNISYYSGLTSTIHDRSFRTAIGKLSMSNYNIKLLNSDKLFISYSIDYRKYLNESIEDPLHSGRIHYDHQIYLSLTKNINSNFKINGFIKLMYRQTQSDYEWVEDLKSFNKNELGIKFIWNGVYDIYH